MQHDPDRILHELHDILTADDGGLRTLLSKSLLEARQRAEVDLEVDLFDALDWPQDLAGYDEYLLGFIRWIPRQSDAKAWQVSVPRSAMPRRSVTG